MCSDFDRSVCILALALPVQSGVADEVDYTGELDVASLVRYAAAKIGRAEEALSRSARSRCTV